MCAAAADPACMVKTQRPSGGGRPPVPGACVWSTTPAGRMHVVDPLWQHSAAGRPAVAAQYRWSTRFNKPGRGGRPHGCGGPGWSTTCMRPARVVDQVDRSALHLVDQVCQPQAVGLRAASSRSCW